jgi:hypothetical protein
MKSAAAEEIQCYRSDSLAHSKGAIADTARRQSH